MSEIKKYILHETEEYLNDLKEWDFDSDREKGKKKLAALLSNMVANPFKGLGWPEPLKYTTTGIWSRRIIGKHRLTYIVQQDVIHLLSCRGHYN